MPDPMNELASAIAGDEETPSASLRISTVTAVEATGTRRVQTAATGTTWLSRDAGTTLAVGDKVYLIQQGGVWLVAGRLTGGDATPIGTINNFAGSVAPTGWLMCNGQAISRTTYAALYAIVGNAYGAGDGSTTFNVPNLVNRVPVGSGGTYTQTQTGGAATVTLTSGQIPAHDHGGVGDHNHGGVGDHTHSVPGAAGDSTVASGTGATVGNGASGSTGGAGGHTHSNDGGHTHSSFGGGGSHENMPPFLALPYIIRAG